MFNMYKFRTMIPNAEEVQAELMSMNEMNGPVFKIKNDPARDAARTIFEKDEHRRITAIVQRAKGRNEPGRSSRAVETRFSTF